MQVGMPTWRDGFRKGLTVLKVPVRQPFPVYSSSPIHEEACRAAWESVGSPLPLQGPVQPFPARVGGLGFRAATSHAGLFGGLGRARIHNEAPGPRASPRQHSSQ